MSKIPQSKKKPVVVDLDSLTKICGFFNSDTPVNNHYGCNHKNCDENELVRIDENGEQERIFDNKLERQIVLTSLRKKYGSWKNIEEVLKTKSGIKFLNEIRNNKLQDHEFVKKFGCKIQGKCYSFSCPIANECDLEDLKKYDKDLYNEYKDSEYSPSEKGANLMLITDKSLIEKLS